MAICFCAFNCKADAGRWISLSLDTSVDLHLDGRDESGHKFGGALAKEKPNLLKNTNLCSIMRMYYAGPTDIRVLVHDVFRHGLRGGGDGPSRTLERRGALSTGISSEAPLARIVAECAVCGHGSNHLTALAYNVNHVNTGDSNGGGERPSRSCELKASWRPQGRHGRARSHKKPERRHNSRRIVLDSGRQKTQQSLSIAHDMSGLGSARSVR